MTGDEPKGYVVERVRRALASDERVNELSVEVTVRGRRIFLSGPVSSAERRDAISTVVGELLPEYEITNGTSVARALEPDEAEDLR